MGKKARNAGKKVSKTCDKPATTKSVCPTGGRITLVERWIDSDIDIDLYRPLNKKERAMMARHRNGFVANVHTV